MMRLYFSPECVKPPFLNDSKSSVQKCWALDGSFYALFFIVLLFISWAYYKTRVTITSDSNTTFIILSVAIAIVVPYMFWFSGGNLWQGYRDTIDTLVGEGFTRKEAINFLQGVDESSRRTDAKSAAINRLVFTKTDTPVNTVNAANVVDILQPSSQNIVSQTY